MCLCIIQCGVGKSSCREGQWQSHKVNQIEIFQVAELEQLSILQFLSLKMAVKTVGSFEEALEHINKYTSKHSEAIISENPERIATYQKLIDASSVYSNASTAFTDGAQFGLGAEIGISTQKLHARGPMALEELTSYKWIIEGTGQVRPK